MEINIEKLSALKKYNIERKALYKRASFVKRNDKIQPFKKAVEEALYQNHNHSWFDELKESNQNNLENIALFYRGTTITYRKMIDKMEEYANHLAHLGIKKGTEIPVCTSNCPEFVYILGAASILGAKLKIFGEDFKPEHIKRIIKKSDSKIFIATDDLFQKLNPSIIDDDITKIIFSLTDSLPNGRDPYIELDKDYYDFTNKISEIKKNTKNVMDINEFENLPLISYKKPKITLDDEFSITFSSGSTNEPKSIVHTVKSFVAMGRWHDTNISHSPNMSWMTVLAEIYVHSNTGLICCISDGLLQGCKVALEPIHNHDFFINSLLINKPHYAIESRSFWLNTMKKLENDPAYKNTKFPFLMVPFSVGEPLAPGEEKYLNKMLRKARAGSDKIPIPISPITMSVAGGSCEHGGIFFILFRALHNKIPSKLFTKNLYGMESYETVEYATLRENGEFCNNNEIGKLVANSICTMKEYQDNPEATKAFFIHDIDGKEWADCNVFASIDRHNSIDIKGRISENHCEVQPYEIMEIIQKDTKNILSCEVIKTEKNGKKYFVAHIEPQPKKYYKIIPILISCEKRCQKFFGKELSEQILFAPTTKKGIPIAVSGKRATKDLEKQGITENCVKPIQISKNNFTILNFEEYEHSNENYKEKVLSK